MNRMVLVALACGLVAPLAHVGCSGDSGPSTPTGATRAPLTVTALAVAGCLAADNYQCRAMASMSNAHDSRRRERRRPSGASLRTPGVATISAHWPGRRSMASGNVQLRAELPDACRPRGDARDDRHAGSAVLRPHRARDDGIGAADFGRDCASLMAPGRCKRARPMVAGSTMPRRFARER